VLTPPSLPPATAPELFSTALCVDCDAGTSDYGEGSGASASADTDNAGMVVEVTKVVVSGIAVACIGQNIDLSLSNNTGKEVEAGQRGLLHDLVTGHDNNLLCRLVVYAEPFVC
jgi:hypothetical protein